MRSRWLSATPGMASWGVGIWSATNNADMATSAMAVKPGSYARLPVSGAILGLSHVQGRRRRRQKQETTTAERALVTHQTSQTIPGGAAWTPDEGSNWFALPNV